MTNEKNTNVKFEHKHIAQNAYALCEMFIRSCEAKNENNKKLGIVSETANSALYDECVANFDYYVVGKVLSMASNRKASFESYVESAANGKADRQQRAYKWLMMNAVYENYTMYILEQFKHAYITKDKNANVWNGFIEWIGSTKNSNGTFTFFADTSQPLIVR
jgi:hypothetical protein|tara:strand:- start:366 stop:854 length:489 start_codon:yes stop_codon:yes gene_type:complete